jgi:tetratricopeptide (TPR) repeat protein/lipopolysaccharide biosynthesis regulator YciM
LGKRGFLPENRILLLGETATLEAINTALGTIIFDRAKENDLVVIYFAGHSAPVTIEDSPEAQRSEVFLAPFDFKRQLIQDSSFFRTQHSLGMERLRRTFFEGSGARKRLFIFDSCYSGDFYGPGYRDDTDQVPGYVQFMLNSNVTGRIFMASCLPYQKAIESSKYGHGYFTYYLLQALRGDDTDALRRDGTLTAGSLFDYLNDKLKSQKPVKGGVEFGSFELARFAVPALIGTKQIVEEKEPGKEARLKSMYADQNDYVQDRLKRFVGRETELKDLRERIAGKMEYGGYVVIKGDAGQGKSSIIAKLIESSGIDDSAYHFAQPGSGFNYQINLLRNLMARLIMKYDLPEYYVVGESYQIFCGNFLGVLKAIAEKKAQEVIYIDGLDQLEMDPAATVPNLSFLPSRLPVGIVIVMGTRPNKTLDEVLRLTQLKPDESYPLQGLSREDFDLLLQRHKVPLSVALSNSLYQRLTNNPLYLDLVARELRASHGLGSEQLIARVASDPNDIFTITFSRMEQMPAWDDVIRPMLGILLVTQEPLTSQQIAHIIQQGNARVAKGITQLGGLLTLAGKLKYTLFHPKLKEYLKQNADGRGNAIQFDAEEVETLHGQVATWCEQGAIEELWSPLLEPTPRDDYQDYAQKYYIFHLYKQARRYERLFEVLDQGDYERGKLAVDKSTRSTAMDLILGCQAAARAAKTLIDGKKLLLHLWRYTLLRTNLTTRADAYPVAAFQALLDLGREQVALDLAELLTQPASKLTVLTLITEYFLKQPGQEVKGMQLTSRVYEMASSTQDNDTRTRSLRDLAMALMRTGRLEQAEDIARLIVSDDEQQAATFNNISDAYGKQSKWEQAEAVAHLITTDEERVKALSCLAAKLKRANEATKAEELWQEASRIVSTIADNAKRSRATYYLSASYMQVQDWERARTVARSIDDGSNEKIRALSQLALSLTLAELALQAEIAWEEAQIAIEEVPEKYAAYRIYVLAQVQTKRYEEAEYTASRYLASNPIEKMVVFGSLASNLVKEHLWEESRHIIDLIVKEYDLTDVTASELDDILMRLSIDLACESQWNQARSLAFTIPTKDARCTALMGIVSQLAQAGMSQRAEKAWEETSAICTTQTDTVQAGVAAILVEVFVKAGQVAQAKQIIHTLPDRQTQEYIMEKVAVALASAGQIEEAEEIARETTSPMRKDTIRRSIAIALAKARQPEEALATVLLISRMEKQSQARVDLVKTHCQMHQWDFAQQIAHQIQSDPLRAEARRHIIIALVQNGQRKLAENVVSALHDGYYKEDARCTLATTVAQMGASTETAMKYVHTIKKNDRIRQKAECNIYIAAGSLGLMIASSIALAIEAGTERNDALHNVAIAYAHENRWDEAEKMADEMSDLQRRDETWATIAQELAQVGQWVPALAAFEKIRKTQKSDQQRISVLRVWGTLLTKPADLPMRQQIVRLLSKSEEKASLVVSIANTLAQAGSSLEQIRFTQQTWLQAGTKDDCGYLFAMVRDLLSLDPEMCTGFYESFGWVDTFLKVDKKQE